MTGDEVVREVVREVAEALLAAVDVEAPVEVAVVDQAQRYGHRQED